MKFCVHSNGEGVVCHRFIVDDFMATLQQSPDITHSHKLNRENIEKMVDDYLSPKEGYGCLVATYGDHFAGCLLYRVVKDLFYSCVYIQYICSSEQFRRNGVATQLMEAVIGLAKKQGFYTLSVRIQDWNEASKSFFTLKHCFRAYEFHFVKTSPSFFEKEKDSECLTGPQELLSKTREMQAVMHEFIEAHPLLQKQKLILANFIGHLTPYLNHDKDFGVLGCLKNNQLDCFALYRKVYHPFKNYLFVPFFSCKKREGKITEKGRNLLCELEAQMQQWNLPELAIRVPLHDAEMEKFCKSMDYKITDKNYIRFLD